MYQLITCDPQTVEEAKIQLVLGSRVLANEGILDCFGHISVRNPENPNTFLQSRSISAELVTLDDVMELDLNGKTVNGPVGAKTYWERVLHARIYAVRPDVQSVFHGHPIEIIPFTALPELPLLPVANSAGVFYNGYSYYSAVTGSDMTVSTLEEADLVAAALEEKWAVLMRNHGVTACAGNIPQLVMDMIAMVRNAAIYMDCLKIGKTPLVCSPEEGFAYRQSHHKDGPLLRNFLYYVHRAKKAMTDIANI